MYHGIIHRPADWQPCGHAGSRYCRCALPHRGRAHDYDHDGRIVRQLYDPQFHSCHSGTRCHAHDCARDVRITHRRDPMPHGGDSRSQPDSGYGHDGRIPDDSDVRGCRRDDEMQVRAHEATVHVRDDEERVRASLAYLLVLK